MRAYRLYILGRGRAMTLAQGWPLILGARVTAIVRVRGVVNGRSGLGKCGPRTCSRRRPQGEARSDPMAKPCDARAL